MTTIEMIECGECGGQGCPTCRYTGEVEVTHPRPLVDVVAEPTPDPEPAKDPAGDMHIFRPVALCLNCDHPSYEHHWEEEPDSGDTTQACTHIGCRCEEYVPILTERCSMISWGSGEKCVLGVGHDGSHLFPDGTVREADAVPTTLHPTSYTISGSAVSGYPVSVSGYPEPPALPRTPHPEDEVNACAGWARTWASAPHTRRESLRQYAVACVNLREKFSICHDGVHVDPDWRCRAYDTRDSMSEVKHRSGISEDDWKHITGNARYHVSAIVRKRATPDELARAGLSPLTAKERVQGGRESRTAAYESDLLVILADLARAVVADRWGDLDSDDPVVLAIERARAYLPEGMIPS